MMQVISIIFVYIVVMTTCSILASNSMTTPVPNPGNCQLHNIQKGQSLNFTSEEYVPVINVLFDRYAKLSCSVRNYCSISWFKNEAPLDIKMFMKLKDNNQTLEIQKALYTRAGNYTCVASDGANSVSRTFKLFISERPWKQPALALAGKLCTNQTTSLGDSAEFFCFFFAGDIVREINLTWYKQMDSATWQSVNKLNLEKTMFEERIDYTVLREYSGSGLQPTAGKHLLITHVTEEAYSSYQLNATSNFGVTSIILSLSAPSPAPPPDLTAIISTTATVACLLVLLVLLAVMWHFYKLDIKIWGKNRFGALEDDDGKSYDVFISYADEDLAFALDVREKLEVAGYSAFMRDIDIVPATTLVEEIIVALNTSRRCLILISPDFIRGRHSALQVDVATEQMLHKQIKIVPIIYRDVSSPDHREAMPPLLKRILTNVSVVKWQENGPDRSFKRLLVHLPPHRLTMATITSQLDQRNLLVNEVDKMDRFLRDVEEAAEVGNRSLPRDQSAVPC